MTVELLATIVAGVFTLVTTALGIWLKKRLDEVHFQVKNSHTTNMREDIDKVIDKLDDLADGVSDLREGQRRHDGELAELRKDLRHERSERLAGDSLHRAA